MEADASYVTGQKIFVLLVFLLHWKCELHDLEGWSAAYRILVTECCVSVCFVCVRVCVSFHGADSSKRVCIVLLGGKASFQRCDFETPLGSRP